jgi:phage gp36-like protein
MSRYIDQAYLETRWGAARVERLATEAVSDGGAADDAIAQAIEDAESIATSYLLPRFGASELPTETSATPASLKQNVADMAMYQLARHHDQVGDDLVRARDAALSWLRSVSRGHADLGLAGAPRVDSSRGDVLTTKSVTSAVFGNGGLDGW